MMLKVCDSVSIDDALKDKLQLRLGNLHARQRLGIETDHEAQIFGQGINFFISRTGIRFIRSSATGSSYSDFIGVV
jgi:hypothetical protein